MAAKLSDLATGFRPEILCPVVGYQSSATISVDLVELLSGYLLFGFSEIE
jgi:hypothetical protein